MADFDALNHWRSQTLRQIREMVSEEAALWARYFNGQDTAEIVAGIDSNRARFRALWDQHEEVPGRTWRTPVSCPRWSSPMYLWRLR